MIKFSIRRGFYRDMPQSVMREVWLVSYKDKTLRPFETELPEDIPAEALQQRFWLSDYACFTKEEAEQAIRNHRDYRRKHKQEMVLAKKRYKEALKK